MADVDRPGFVVALLVRAGVVRVPARHRAWLARELLAQAARRRTAIAGMLPSGLAFTAAWLLLDTFGDQAGPPAWVYLAGALPALLLGALGFGYRRQARLLQTRNRLAADADGGEGTAVTG